MIDNAGNSFKNQGDCVSYFATKGKNLGAVPPVVVADATAADSTAAHVKHSPSIRTRRPLRRRRPSDSMARSRPRATTSTVTTK